MNNRKANLKKLLVALVMATKLTSAAGITAYATDLVDETDEWTQEGTPTYEDITEQEQEEHTQQNIEQQESGEEGPAPQDAEAVVDNSQGGEKPSEEPQPVENPGKGPEERAEEAKPEDVHPEPGLKDEWDYKTEGDTPTPPTPPTPDEPTPDEPTPEQPQPEQPQPVPEQPVQPQPVVVEQKIKKMGAEGMDPGLIAGISSILAASGVSIGFYKLTGSRKAFNSRRRNK
jgi:hypothetical protein